MSEELKKLVEDSEMALENIRDAGSPAHAKAAARWLQSIAAEMLLLAEGEA